MKILFTCGGTAGHINPALALARMFRERDPEGQLLFVGAKGGMEEKLVPQAGFTLETVRVGSFWRKMSWAGVVHNADSLVKLYKSKGEARDILSRFQPDLVVGTGGYASYPVVREAARLGIPTAVHESNAVPGLTTRQLAPHVDCVMVGFQDSNAHYSQAKRVAYTGTPVRGEFFQLDRSQARERLGIPQEALLVLSVWGSLGANHMNDYMVDFIEAYADDKGQFYHIHGAGGSYQTMMNTLNERGISLPKTIWVEEYLYDMPAVMQAADLVLCRGGASTISELSVIGKAAIIVPSPNVTNNHQECNARVLEAHGAAQVILEEACSGKFLYERVAALLTDEPQRQAMEKAIHDLGKPNAAEQIYQTLVGLIPAASGGKRNKSEE